METLYFTQNGKRRKAKEITCAQCTTLFLTRLNSDSKFCSARCARESTKKRLILECFNCKGSFERTESKFKNSSKHNFHFCSRKCKEFSQSLKGNCPKIRPDHYGNSSGISTYRKLAFESFSHKCNRCEYNKILDVLQVHHKDRNRENNKLENLEILCPTCHMEEHYLTNSGSYTK
jgi:hypothetical protein